MGDDQVDDVDAVAEAIIRAEKTRRALSLAPDLAEHLRTLVLHSDGRTEPGAAITVERTPLLAGITDDVDALFVLLLEWVAYWADTLEVKPPMTAVAAWTTAGGIRREGPDVAAGFRAGTTPERASALVWSLAFWLLVNDGEISAHPTAATYQDDVTSTVWALRAASRLTNAPVRTTSPRPCPVCGEHTVHGEFFGSTFDAAEKRGERLSAWARRDGETAEQALNQFLAAVAGVEVRCEYCGWTADARPSQIARWLA
jgi:hypothetical protein